jgi:hypothetical protein
MSNDEEIRIFILERPKKRRNEYLKIYSLIEEISNTVLELHLLILIIYSMLFSRVDVFQISRINKLDTVSYPCYTAMKI